MMTAPSPLGFVDVRCPHCHDHQLCNDNPGEIWEYAGETCGLLRCQNCNGRFSYPTPSRRLLEKLYKENFNYDWYRDHYPAKFLDSLMRVAQYVRWGAIKGRILDYGGGLGYFSRAARLYGFDAVTSDPVLSGSTAVSQGLFETIACHHTIEHAPDPDLFMETLAQFLAPDGKLILAVPNGESRGYKTLGSRWTWSQPPFLHIHHFTRLGLEAVLTRHGFAVSATYYFERWDANTFADVKLADRFASWDAHWEQAGWGYAQVNSLRRMAMLLASTLFSPVPPDERPELLLIARKVDR